MAKRAPFAGDDLDRIMTVMATAFDPNYNEAWTRAQVSGALLMGNCHWQLIAADGRRPEEGETAAGFALLRTAYDEEELLLFAVDPALRRLGLGSRLLEWVKEDARARGITRILLEMRQGNSAETLYIAHNFTRVGIRPKYYRDGSGSPIDAITFSCALQ
ncbi:MAG: GNAT family N-acetyltransferase [Pseudomonadota bacterium]|nr:GNAT family N-acetyltransferase [Pseudomonadota bacterium]